jgi:UDP-GlcNAc:undecaprenyl-phosphate GlcNAc-1-phosphate transferase
MWWCLFFGSLGATAILTPIVIWLARRVGAVDGVGYRKIHRSQVPRMGGLAIALPFIVLCGWAALNGAELIAGLKGTARDFAVLAVGCALIVAVGMLDDVFGMRARTKLLAQTLIALFICASGYAIESVSLPLVGVIPLDAPIGMVVTVFWIVGLVNAFNLVDGMDGLAAGIGFIGAMGLGVLASMGGSPYVAFVCVALAGSLLAFLGFNFHPARIFLGDTGSMFIGLVLAVIALMSHIGTESSVVYLAPLLALGFPIFETLVSIGRRLLRGKPVFAGDEGHTHHRLLKLGFSQRQAALILYAAAFSFMVAAILFQLYSDRSEFAWLPLGLYMGTIMALASVAGYLRLPDLVRSSQRRQSNLMLSAFARYAALSLSSKSPLVSSGELMRLARRELGLRFLEAWFEDGPMQITSSGRMRFRTPPERLARFEDTPAFVAAPDGFVSEEEINTLPVDLFQTIRVKSAGSHTIMVRYQHYVQRDEMENQDIAACLAQLFEQTRLVPPLADAAGQRLQYQHVAPM